MTEPQPLTDARLAELAAALADHYSRWHEWSYGVACNTGELLALVQEAQRLRAALTTIRTQYGQVCADFELCHHPACQASCGAWLTADAALRGETVPE